MLVLGPFAGLPLASGPMDDGPSGTVYYTEAADGFSSTAILSIRSNSVIQEGNDTAAGTGSLPITSNSLIQEGNDVITTNTTLLIVGNGVYSDAIDSLGSFGRLHILANLSTVNDADTLTALGGLTPVIGNVAYTDAPDTLSSTAIHGKIKGTATTSFGTSGTIIGKGLLVAATTSIFNVVGEGKARAYGSGTINSSFTAAGTGITKGYMQGSATFNTQVSASIAGKGSLAGSSSSSFTIGTGRATLRTSGTTSLTTTVSGTMEALYLAPVLQGLVAPANAYPRIMLAKSIPDYRFYWIETTNQTEKKESIYAAFVNTATGQWDRKHILTGNDALPGAVQYDAEFVDGKVFGSVQLTNVYTRPQPIQNQTYRFEMSGGSMSYEFLRFFTRRVANVVDAYWEDPCPHFANNGSQDFSIWRTADTQRYEIYRHDPLEWKLLDKTLNGQPFYITQLTSFNWISGQFVLVGNNGNIYYSSNGYEWTL